MSAATAPIVHFVGSVPLPDAETVFRTLAAATGLHLKRLPDGETGIRKTWIRFLQQVLADNPGIEVASDVPAFKFTQWDGKLLREIPAMSGWTAWPLNAAWLAAIRSAFRGCSRRTCRRPNWQHKSIGDQPSAERSAIRMKSGTAAATPVQRFKTLCGQLCIEERHSRDIGTWMPKAFCKDKL